MRFFEAYAPLENTITHQKNSLSAVEKREEERYNEKYLFESDIDNTAYQAGWLVLCPDEAFEKCLTRGSSVFILKEDDLWVVWRGSWMNNNVEPTGQKTIAKTPSFHHALHYAEQYIARYTKWKKNAHRKR